MAPHTAAPVKGIQMQHTIDAEQLQLALAARRVGMASRWAAMSAHVHTQRCDQHDGTYRMRIRSLAGPMDRGTLHRVIARVTSQGRREVLATFGCGMRAIHVDAGNYFLKA